jgi:hypothetical protein
LPPRIRLVLRPCSPFENEGGRAGIWPFYSARGRRSRHCAGSVGQADPHQRLGWPLRGRAISSSAQEDGPLRYRAIRICDLIEQSAKLRAVRSTKMRNSMRCLSCRASVAVVREARRCPAREPRPECARESEVACDFIAGCDSRSPLRLRDQLADSDRAAR